MYRLSVSVGTFATTVCSFHDQQGHSVKNCPTSWILVFPLDQRTLERRVSGLDVPSPHRFFSRRVRHVFPRPPPLPCTTELLTTGIPCYVPCKYPKSHRGHGLLFGYVSPQYPDLATQECPPIFRLLFWRGSKEEVAFFHNAFLFLSMNGAGSSVSRTAWPRPSISPCASHRHLVYSPPKLFSFPRP